MFKTIFSILFIFFLAGPGRVRAQGGGDTSETVEVAAEDSLYQPVPDSSYVSGYYLRRVPQVQVNKYLTDPAFAYANDPQYWKEEPPEDPGFLLRLLTSKTVRWVVFLSILGILLYGIYQLAKENNFQWLTRNKKLTAPGSGEESLPDEEMDYDDAIRRYQTEGNYRLAIRYMYLRLIGTIGEKSGIRIRDSSTNAEITLALGNRPQAGEFRYLATAYEYIFYGGFIPKRELFDMLKIRFEAFQKIISV